MDSDRVWLMLVRIIAAAIIAVPMLVRAAEPPITAIEFSPNGQSVVVGSQSEVRVVGWPDLKQQSIIDSHAGKIHDLAFSPDGTALVVVGGSPAEFGRIEMISWPEVKPTHAATIGEDAIYCATWQADGISFLIAGPDHSLALIDRQVNQVKAIEGHSRDVVTVEVLSDEYFVSGSRDNTIRVWNTRSHKLIRTLNNHTDEIHDIAVRPGNTAQPFVIASASEDRTVRLWWPVRGRLMRFAKLPSPALDIEWTATGDLLVASCADGHLRVIDPDTVQIVRDIEVSPGWLYALAVSPDGKQAVVGGAGGLLKTVTIR